METHGASSGADLLMSHFVSSEIPDDPINPAQIERFEAARAAFPHLPASLANSSGMFLDPAPIYDLAPSGLCALWRQSDAGPSEPDAPGRDADRGDPADPLDRGRRDLRLQRPMDRQAPDPPRDRCSSAMPTACRAAPARPMRGRAPRSRSPAGAAALVGRVSMDLTIVDVTDLPEDAVRPGDPVEFFGPTIDLDDFATRSGTIGYHLLTSLGPRHRRDYVRER